MTELTRAPLKSPYLVMLGDETRPTFAKTGFSFTARGTLGTVCPETAFARLRITIALQ